MSKLRTISSAFSRLRNALTGRELVGRDNFGNAYYLKTDKDDSGQEFKRRIMEAPGGSDHKLYNPDAINTLWRQWLSRTRIDPPTDQELQRWAPLTGLI